MIRTVTQTIWHTIRRHRIVAIIIASVIVLTAAYVLWSKYTWNEYEADYTAWRSSTHGQLDKALALPVKTAQERSGKFLALKDVSNTITTAQDSLCKVNAIVAWQQFIKPLGEQTADCNAMITAAGSLNESLKKAILYLENEKSLADILDVVHGDKTELAEGDWNAQAAAWHMALEKTDKMMVSEAFAPTKKVARDTIKSIDDAWQAVMAAHKAKDKAAYIKAQTLLVQTYGALGNILDSNTKQLKTLLDPLQAQYNAVFKQ